MAVAEFRARRVSLWVNDGTGSLAERTPLSTDLYPIGVVAADFNGDGMVDLAVAMNSSPGIVELFKGRGDGSFDEPDRYEAGLYPDGIAAGDLDGDGRPDLVVANYVGTSITVLRNRGDGFDPGVQYECGPGPATLVVADLDRDGHPDVAVANSGCTSISVFHNLGDGTLDQRLEYLTQQGALSIDAGDVDGDGWTDLSVVGFGYVAEVLWNDRAGEFLEESLFDVRSGEGGAVVLADFDRDGRMDVGFSSFTYAPGWFSILLNRGSRTEFARVDYLVESTRTLDGFSMSAAADFDADGLPDFTAGVLRGFAILRHSSRSVLAGLADIAVDPDVQSTSAIFLDYGRPTIMVRTGSGTFLMRPDREGLLGAPEDYPEGSESSTVDLNYDGCADLLIPRGDWLEIHFCGGAPERLARPPGDGRILGLADFNGDRLPDYLLAEPEDSLAIAFGDPAGGFTDPVPIRGSPLLSPPYPYHTVVTPADLDGDGSADLVVGFPVWADYYFFRDSVTILRNGGNGVFSVVAGATVSPCPYPGCYIPVSQILPADVDVDGRADLLLFTSSWDSRGELWVLRNRGEFRFELRPTPYDAPSEGPTLCAHDFNADGLPDLAVFTRNDDEGRSRFQLRLNVGGGEFEDPGPTQYLEHYVRSLAIADLNGDAHPEVIFGYHGFYYDGGVSLLLNQIRDLATACTVSLVDVQATGERVMLTWTTSMPLTGTVCRREGSGDWRDLGDVASDGAGRVNYEDSDVVPGARYTYGLRYRSSAGTGFSAEADVVVPAVPVFGLHGVRPNPSDGQLVAWFSVPSRAPVAIELLDAMGRRIRLRRVASPEPGPQSLEITSRGSLPCGMYWVRLTQAGRSAVTKAVVLR